MRPHADGMTGETREMRERRRPPKPNRPGDHGNMVPFPINKIPVDESIVHFAPCFFMPGAGTAPARSEACKSSKYHYNKDGTIVVTVGWKGAGHPRLPAEYKPYTDQMRAKVCRYTVVRMEIQNSIHWKVWRAYTSNRLGKRCDREPESIRIE